VQLLHSNALKWLTTLNSAPLKAVYALKGSHHSIAHLLKARTHETHRTSKCTTPIHQRWSNEAPMASDRVIHQA